MTQKHDRLATLRFHAYVSIGWGLIVMFLVIGGMAGHSYAAAGGALIVSVMWTLLRIGREALISLVLLRTLRRPDVGPDDEED